MSSADPPSSAASRWQAPAEPPPVVFDVRAELAARTLAGSGLEIGALHQPLQVAGDVAVSYVDRMTVEQLREHYPELRELDLVEVDVVDDGERLATVADGSQDFIVANHFLEHTGDPISTIETHLRKLAPGGALFYAVPDKRYTFDVARAVTPVEHMLRDRAEGPHVSRRAHYEDWARNVYGSPADPPRSEAEIAQLARDLDERDYSIHTHVWTQAEFLQLLLTCRELFAEQFDLEAVWKAGMELLVVLRKAGAAPIVPRGAEGPAARPALARSDVGVYISDLEMAIRQRDGELAELRAELVLERARTRELMSSPAWKAGRPLRGVQRAVELTRRRLQERRRDSGGVVAVALAGLAAELDGGWPVGARWHPAAELPGGRGEALEQPVGERIAYRLTLPAGAGLRCDVALPLLTWSDCDGGVAFEATLEAANGNVLGRWRAAVAGASTGSGWKRAALDVDFALAAPLEVVLVLSLGWTGDPAAGLGAGRGLWVEPTLLLPEAAVGAVAPAPAEAARAAVAIGDAGEQTAPPAAAERGEGPLISLLTPVHDPDPAFLEQLLDQVERQSFGNWQLCLVDDGSKDPRVLELIEQRVAAEPRMALRRHETARGIVGATNAALELATGAFVAFLDHDDVLPTDALATVAEALAAAPESDLLYSDEDHILHNGRRYEPYLKPDWSPDLLRSIMFTGHLGVIRRSLVEQLGGLREQFEGSQDYDLVLRASERTDRIVHLPRILYHWRVHERSTAAGEAAKPYAYEAARRALDEHLRRIGIAGHVQPADAPGRYRIVHELPAGTSIALLLALDEGLTRPGWEQALTRCAETWDGPHAAPAIVVAGTAARVEAAERALAEAGIGPGRARRVVSDERERTRLLAAAAEAAADLDLLLWFDTLAAVEPEADDWLLRLAGHALQPGVGAVGAKLLAPDGRVEQAGVVVPGGRALPAHHGAEGDHDGHLANLRVAGNWSAVSGVVMTTRERFAREHGLDAACGPLAEVDFCLRLRARGERIVLVPDALLRRVGPAQVRNDALALERLRRRWSAALPADPYYNPGFWQGRGDFAPAD